MDESFKKIIERKKESYSERKKQEEGFLKEAIKKGLDKEWVRLRVGLVCTIIIQIKKLELQLQSKIIESADYIIDVSNWKKVEGEVRTKFNVPKSFPLFFK